MKNKGGGIFHLAGILFLSAGFFILPKICFSSGGVVINEIMPNPEGTDGTSEWVELYNNSDSEVNLENWELDPDSGNYFSLKGKTIKNNDFLVIAGLSGMRNSYGQVSLYNSSTHNESTMVDYVQYGRWDTGTTENKIRDRAISKGIWTANDFVSVSAEGKSMELQESGKDNNSSSDWQESYVSGGTPGKSNSKKPEDPEKPAEEKKVYSDKIRINELLPHPGAGESEFIELYNPGSSSEDLSGWQLQDASKTKCELSGKIEKDEFYIPEECSIKLNDTGGETLALYDPDGIIVSSVEYSVSAKENVSYSFDGAGWRWSSKATKGKENEFDEVPGIKIKKDEKIYKNIYANFEVKTGDENQKVTWDFGDGGSKSYLQKTKHKYLNAGTYQVTLTVKGKSDDFVENFIVEVGKFGESKIKIISVKANPKGKDDKESITIQNNSKKKINLKNWSIATGWKNLYNHPISKKLIIKPGEKKEILKKYSAFALNNKQTKIELRRPDGSVAAKVKYSKKEGVQDDEVYEKGGNGWTWNAPNDTEANVESEEKSLVTEPLVTENENKEIIEENPDNNRNNQTENNSEVQVDEPAENMEQGEVLGEETVKENMADVDKDKPGFFESILSKTNQTINNLINFFF